MISSKLDNTNAIMATSSTLFIQELPTSITIMVVGKMGSGKSTLINSILGPDGEQATERHEIVPKATKLKLYQCMVGKVQVKIWDSPGLLAPDGTRSKEWNVEIVKRNCKDVDLYLFCNDMSKYRSIEAEHCEAMRLLNKTFCSDIWKNTLFVLTFANAFLIEARPDFPDRPEDLKKDFEEQIRSWKGKLHEAMEKERIDTRYLKVVPAGDYSSHHLFESDNTRWLNELWRKAISVAKPIAAPAALKVHDHLLRREQGQEYQSSSILTLAAAANHTHGANY